MGLDMYAYAAPKSGTDDSYARNQLEIAYWRKHPNLHGWMEQLWRTKNNIGDLTDPMFNGIELELTWEDIAQLEQDIKEGNLPNTSGFFFGTDSDDYYRTQDLDFIAEARTQIFLGFKVFYNSSW
jgi:hypothetical protein